jgi:imidazoleglycerol phosphate dehydratase HisB
MILNFSSSNQVLWQDCESRAAKDVKGRAKLALKQNSNAKHMNKKAVDMDEELFGASMESKGCTIQFVQLPHSSGAQ